MANIAYFNVNIYAIEVNKGDVFLEEGKYCLEFNFDDFRTMRTSAREDFQWPKEYLHTKYSTEYPQHLNLKVLTVHLVKPSVFGFSDQYQLNPVRIDLETIATGIMRYKVCLAEGFTVAFILEMTQVSDVSIEIRNLRYTITDRSAFRSGSEYRAVVTYEPGGHVMHAKELSAFAKANLQGEAMEPYRERKKDEVKALRDRPVQKVRSRIPATVDEESGTLEWAALSRIVVDDTSFRDLYYSNLYIGIKKIVKDKHESETPYLRCAKIPISKCLMHESAAGKRDEGSFPGDEDKIIHLSGVLEASIYLNDVPYYMQVFAKDHYVFASYEREGESVLMLENREDGSAGEVESVPSEVLKGALHYRSRFVKYGVPCEVCTPEPTSTEDEKSACEDAGSDDLLASDGTEYSTGSTLTRKLLK